MTDKEELVLLQAIQNMRKKKPHFDIVYFRLNDVSVLDKNETPEDFLRNYYIENEIVDKVIDGSFLSMKEWDKISFEIEYRTPEFCIKYPKQINS